MTEPMIDVRDLWKSFGGNQVLKGVNLQMMPGTTTVVLGGSGSGKTVLMKHIMGLFNPDHGESTWTARTSPPWTASSWRSSARAWRWRSSARRSSDRP